MALRAAARSFRFASMISFVGGSRWLLGALLCLGLWGCLPATGSRTDEENEPYFQRGKALAGSLDYTGAIYAYEKALEVNPHNARAHFELGLLYQRNDTDLPAAIFHFNRFLQLRPDSDQADTVRQRINACKQDLARAIAISLAPVTQAMQRDLEHALAENTRLTAENQELRRQVAAWTAYYARFPSGVPQPTNAAPAESSALRAAPPPEQARTPAAPARPARESRPAVTTTTRSYTVQRGESLYTIARKHGVKLSALQAANPGVDPRRLRAGQNLTIPPS